MKPDPKIRVAVRALVESGLAAGDLITEYWDSTSPREGLLAHQSIQSDRPENYTPEVHVAYEVESCGIRLTVQGRIDGVYDFGDFVRIEEIKTTRRDLKELEQNPNDRHWAQARVYSFLYGLLHRVERVETQLLYFHLDTEEQVQIRQSLPREELESFFYSLVDRYAARQKAWLDWLEERSESIRQLEFPYAVYRPYQRNLAVHIFRAIREGRHILAEAPTGIGKTMGAVFAAVKALGEGLGERIVYLTAKTTGQSVALKAMQDLRAKGLKMRVIQLTAKEKVCFAVEGDCGRECPYAKGYYDRVEGAVAELLELQLVDREAIEQVAQKHQVCPFELSLDLSVWADCIICDYNYALDPRVYLHRIFGEERGRSLFLVDEAHNLVDRAREMFSATLDSRLLDTFSNRFRSLGREQREVLGKIRHWFDARSNLFTHSEGCQTQREKPADLEPLLREFRRHAAFLLPRLGQYDTEKRDAFLDLHFAVTRFLRIGAEFDERYACSFVRSAGQVEVKLICLDPSRQLREQLKRCASAAFFSATLSPFDYFKDLFGCPSDAVAVSLPSPFPRENLKVMVADRISTHYRQREKTCGELYRYLLAFSRHRQGNYLIFFPSYEYLMLVAEPFLREGSDLDVILQEPGMSEGERIRFLSTFAEARRRTLVGFAVMGGIFGEAIDLVGNRLTGAAVVGVGLPGISRERDLIRNYYDALHGSGFEYAYSFPGFNRVLQAAGRVIRSEEDRGAVLLIDQRFSRHSYRRLFPTDWQPVRVGSHDQLHEVLAEFWRSHGTVQ